MASAFCPAGCREGYCQQAATGGGLQCGYCANSLLLGSGDNSGLCLVSAGRWQWGSADMYMYCAAVVVNNHSGQQSQCGVARWFGSQQHFARHHMSAPGSCSYIHISAKT